jgi:hypothetical protein
LADALAPFAPYLRDAPPNLPFRWDAETLQRGLNFTLGADAGPIDLFGEVVERRRVRRAARGGSPEMGSAGKWAFPALWV